MWRAFGKKKKNVWALWCTHTHTNKQNTHTLYAHIQCHIQSECIAHKPIQYRSIKKKILDKMLAFVQIKQKTCVRSGWSKSTLKGNSYCAYFEHRFTTTTTMAMDDDEKKKRDQAIWRRARNQTRCNDYKTQFLLFDPFEWDLHKLPCTSWASVANNSNRDRSKKE